MEEGVQYELSYENNVEVGQATVILTGIGEYTGTKRASFEIEKLEFVDYKEWSPKPNVRENKVWTIRFSRAVDWASLKETQVAVFYEGDLKNPILVRLQPSKDGKILTVSPILHYLQGGRYYLVIRDLYAADGKKLKENIRMLFTVRK